MRRLKDYDGSLPTPPTARMTRGAGYQALRCLTVAVVRVGPTPRRRPSSCRGRPV